jgi:hypothetical protein
MPRKFLLATTAAAALLGAASLGAAQGTHQGEPGGATGMHSQAQGSGTQEERGQAGVQQNRGANEQRGEANTRMQSGKSDREMGAGQNTERNQQMGAGKEENQPQKGAGNEERQHQEMGAGNKEEMQRNNQRSEENTRERGRRSETTGERNRERGGMKHEGTGPGRAQSNEGINERTGPGRMQGNERGQRSEEGNSRFESARSVRLSNQQRTKIRDTFTHEHVQRVDHPDFSLRVGTAVPRSVQVYDVPEDIVMIVPQYRGLKYIIVRDEVVFLDPDTLEIVAIMPA